MNRAIGVTLFLFTCVVPAAAQSVPNPTVNGPIPAMVAPGNPSHDYPFFSTNVNLASRGYIEEEFLFEGTANTYDLSSAVPMVTSSGHFYRTRMLVRRPVSPETFNGTIVMEWLNVTAGYDIDALWLHSHDHLMRKGYAWIGVSVQKNGVHTAVTGLRAWSPIRYGAQAESAHSLDLTDNNTITNDGLCWDVFSQAAQAVRHPQGVDPMGDLNVERIFAGGWSQSANRLVTYHNSIHPVTEVFDAFTLLGNDGAPLALRTDLSVKVFKVQPETNVAGNGQGISQALLRPLEPPTDHFRRWEVAGAAQLDYHDAQQTVPLQVRDNLPPTTGNACVLPAFSRIPWHFVTNAAYDHMVAWVKHDVAPPIGPDIEIAGWNGNFAILTRDQYGNALGGIRLSQHSVPTATNTGLNTPVATGCRYVGSYVPFDEATLQALYPDHQTYLDLVIAATHQTQKRGFIVGADAAATIREAAQSEIGGKY